MVKDRSTSLVTVARQLKKSFEKTTDAFGKHYIIIDYCVAGFDVMSTREYQY